MTAQAVVIHQIPGRARILILEKRGDSDYFRSLSDEFSRVDGVQKVKVNSTTGSLILEFAGGLSDIVRRSQSDRFFSINSDSAEQRLPASPNRPTPVSNETHEVNLVSGHDINPMFMVGSALGVIGVVQTFRGQVLAPAISLFWYALESFRQSRSSPKKGNLD
jgi:hypothetical protein